MSIQEKVREFIRMYVLLGDAYMFNDDDVLLNKTDGSIIMMKKPNGDMAPVALYDPAGMNAENIIINPFIEGLNNSDVSKWFYETRSMVIAGLIYRIMEGIITKAIACKDSSLSDQNLTSAEINTVQPYVNMNEVDQKLLKELTTVFKENGIRNFFNIYYSRKTYGCELHAGLFDEKFLEAFTKNVRKRSWPILTKLFLQVLDTSDIREIKTAADIPGCAKFDAYTKMYTLLLKKLRKVWSFQSKEFDFDKFFNHVDAFSEYYNTARTVISVPVGKVKSSGVPPWEGPATPSMVPVGGVAPTPVVSPSAGNTMVPIGGSMMTPNIQPIGTQPFQGGTTGMMPVVAGAQPMMAGNQFGMPVTPMIQPTIYGVPVQTPPQPQLPMMMPNNSGMAFMGGNPIQPIGVVQPLNTIVPIGNTTVNTNTNSGVKVSPLLKV